MESEPEDTVEMIHWRALSEFARMRMPTLARKVIYRLQRLSASGIFGDDYRFKTMWDEFCQNVQSGSYDDSIDDAFDDILCDLTGDVIKGMPQSELNLLALSAPDFAPEMHGGFGDPDYVRKEITRAVSQIAGGRNMERFDPNSDWT
jgi:hypothetical protein